MTADPSTVELRDAHDKLADFYVEHLDGLLARMPVERMMLDLFGEVTREAGLGPEIVDVGSGTGRLIPYLKGLGLSPRGVDLAPEMVRVARRDHPGVDFRVGDLRALPFGDAELAGAVCWYSLIFLAPEDRPRAFAELARVVKPGGHVVIAAQDGDGSRQRRGKATGLGIEFDAYWMSADELAERLTTAGFVPVFRGSRPPLDIERVPGNYVLAERKGAERKS
ncbi:class I SAM-dependent methyltransferase [Symbioplanes lichenis]|uniref:class I SAM-dependent methyltransferase n=1 Tax=Symbioplanes lichenis TaxID=1629072 RepID=UPI00273878B8|nr:class I SAM-dependent methyltransferase [Actinoplanes lichenis]